MKKLTLIMLVAMIPFLTMAQKRSKKGNKKVETAASYEFMTITGYEIMTDIDKKIKGPGQIHTPEMQLKMMLKANSNVRIKFDFGGSEVKENSDLFKLARGFKSMAEAVNGAANNGWQFISSDVIASGTSKIHYYYMRKDK